MSHGNYPQLSAGWRTVPLKHAVNINPEVLPDSTPPGTVLSYVDIAALENGVAELAPTEVTFEAAPSRARRVLRDGDTILSTVRTYLKAVASFRQVNVNLIASTGFAVLRPNGQLHPRFAYWAALSEPFIDNVVAHSDGVSYPAISPTVLGALPVAVPPPALQERIANFLDDKTARIDALIAEKERLAETLKQLCTEAIDQTVLGGEIKTRRQALKGLEVLGAIPTDWTSSRLKYELEYVTSGSRGWADFYADDGALFIRIGNLTRNSIQLDFSDIQRVTLPNAAEGVRARVLPGDLLISITAYLGSVAVAPAEMEEAYVSQHVSLARPNCVRALPKWLGYVVLSNIGKTFFELQGYGGTKVQLSLEDIYELPVPLPARSVQAARIDVLEERLRRLEQLTAHVTQHISRLREYRSSLISAAVTGQLNISTHSNQQ